MKLNIKWNTVLCELFKSLYRMSAFYNLEILDFVGFHRVIWVGIIWGITLCFCGWLEHGPMPRLVLAGKPPQPCQPSFNGIVFLITKFIHYEERCLPCWPVSTPQRVGIGELAPVTMNWSFVHRLFKASGAARTKFWKSNLDERTNRSQSFKKLNRM